MNRSLAIAVIASLFLAFPINLHATILWEENFENHLWPNWAADCLSSASPDGAACGNPQISSAEALSPAHSVWSHYTAPSVQSGTYIDRSLPSTFDLWMRFYYRTENFVYNDIVQMKHFALKTPAGGTFLWVLNTPASDQIGVTSNQSLQTFCAPQNRLDVACDFYPNVGTVHMANGQWYCVEVHGNNGTPGNLDGVIEVWVNGTQTLHYTGVALLNAAVSPSVTAFNDITHYAQFGGSGDRYIDDLAVGDTRIGCGSAPPADPTPPAAPLNLSVQ